MDQIHLSPLVYQIQLTLGHISNRGGGEGGGHGQDGVRLRVRGRRRVRAQAREAGRDPPGEDRFVLPFLTWRSE
jgi:hypothetical protein